MRAPPDIGGMSPSRAARLSLALLLGGALACDRGDSPPPSDSAPASKAADDPAAPPADPWIPALGSMFVVPFDSQAAVVLFPELPTEELVSSGPLTLLDATGAAGGAGATLVSSDSAVCGVASIVRFRDSIATPWSAGLLAADVSPVRMDSMESLPARDSARVVAELARLASTLPMDPASRFKGLPFAVLSARRFQLAERTVLVAHLVRRVPHEAAPVEEHTLLVAERAASDPVAAPFAVGFHLRSEGTEDAAEHYEALAALSRGANAWLIIARDSEARTMYQVLERSANGRWRARWSRALSC